MLVYLRYTNNLAIARFCSSYGINTFSFSFDALHPYSCSIEQAKEIIHWLYQPKLIIDIAMHQTQEELSFIQQQLGKTIIPSLSINHPELTSIIHNYDEVIVQITSLHQYNSIKANNEILYYELPFSVYLQEQDLIVDTMDTLILTISKQLEILSKEQHITYSIPCDDSITLEQYELFLEQVIP